MAKAKKQAGEKTKKSLQKEVASTLTEIFTDIKNAVGDKKFSRKVKKASKVLAAGAAKVKPAKESKKASKKIKEAKAPKLVKPGKKEKKQAKEDKSVKQFTNPETTA